MEELYKAVTANPGLKGCSPGHVASVLGITRQAIYNAVKRGELDEVRVSDSTRSAPFIIITDESVERYKSRPVKRGRPPKMLQKIKHEYDRFSGLWPPPGKDW